MSIRLIGRLGAAAAVAVGLLAATALPASAVAHDIVIQAGSTINVGTTSTEFGGHSTDNVCAENSTDPTGIPTDWDHTTGSGTVGATTTGWGDFTAGTSTFKSRLVITSGTITVTNSTVSVTLSIRAEFRTCDSTTALCTTNLLSVTLSGSNPSGTIAIPVSTTTTLLGTVHVTVPTTPGACNIVIRSALHSQTASISLNVHVAT